VSFFIDVSFMYLALARPRQTLEIQGSSQYQRRSKRHLPSVEETPLDAPN
jgi:hypothetical protein